MPNFTEKQQKFIANKAAGVKNRDAAIAAGFAANAADVQAAKLMQRADIKDAISAARKQPVAAATTTAMQRDSYGTPMEYLMDVMNHAQMPTAMRLDAAKALMPYQHARIGEKGKKEQAKDRATDIANGKGRHPFRPKAPPSLHVVKTE